MSFSLQNVSDNVAKIRFHFEKHAPAYALGVGMIGMGWTIYETVKSTKKLQEIADEVDERTKAGEVVTPMETTTRIITAVAKPVVIGTLSAGVILKGFHVLNNRVTMLSTALATVNREYAAYRRHVEEKHPELIQSRGELEAYATREDADKPEGKRKKVTAGKIEDFYSGLLYSNSMEYDSTDHIGNQVRVAHVDRVLSNKLLREGYLRLSELLDALKIDLDKYKINRRMAETVGWTSAQWFSIKQTTFTSRDSEGYAQPDIYLEWPLPVSLVGNIDYSKIMEKYDY